MGSEGARPRHHLARRRHDDDLGADAAAPALGGAALRAGPDGRRVGARGNGPGRRGANWTPRPLFAASHGAMAACGATLVPRGCARRHSGVSRSHCLAITQIRATGLLDDVRRNLASCSASASAVRQVWPLGRGKHHVLASRTLVMGVLNATPDSFSDGGQYLLACAPDFCIHAEAGPDRDAARAACERHGCCSAAVGGSMHQVAGPDCIAGVRAWSHSITSVTRARDREPQLGSTQGRRDRTRGLPPGRGR